MELCYLYLTTKDARDAVELTAAALRTIYQAGLLRPEFEVAMNGAHELVAHDGGLGVLAPRQSG